MDPVEYARLMASIEATPITDPLEGVEGPEPIEGEQEQYWEALVASNPDLRTVVPPTPVVITSADIPSQEWTVERLSPQSWKVTSPAEAAHLIFRNVRVDRSPEAEVEVWMGTIRVLATHTTMSLTGRRTLVRACEDEAPVFGWDGLDWRRVIKVSFEMCLDAARTMSEVVDLTTIVVPDDRDFWAIEHMWPMGPSSLTMPGAGGKSTLARALAVSMASGIEVIPGLKPRLVGPVLYVAAEDAKPETHARSIQAICRGIGIDPHSLDGKVLMQRSDARPLHHFSQQIAERARDYAGVILDAQAGLMPGDAGGVRNEAATFWNAVESIGRPVLLLNHPNRFESMNWDESDGRSAGSEVNRDRARMTWAGWSKRLPTVPGASYRLFKWQNTKFNDGPEFEDPFFYAWTYSGTSDEPVLTFTPADASIWPGKGGSKANAGIADSRRVTPKVGGW
jgi:hypothetical protein